MKRSFQLFAYIILVVVGGIMFVIDADGHLTKICIACNSFITNLFGIVSILTGIVGLAGTIGSKAANVSVR